MARPPNDSDSWIYVFTDDSAQILWNLDLIYPRTNSELVKEGKIETAGRDDNCLWGRLLEGASVEESLLSIYAHLV